MIRAFEHLTFIELGRVPLNASWGDESSFPSNLADRIGTLVDSHLDPSHPAFLRLVDVLDRRDADEGTLDRLELQRLKHLCLHHSLDSTSVNFSSDLFSDHSDDRLVDEQVNIECPQNDTNRLEFLLEQLRLYAQGRYSLYVVPGGMIEATGDWIDRISFVDESTTKFRFPPTEGYRGLSAGYSPVMQPAMIDTESILQRMTIRKLITGIPGIGKTRWMQWLGDWISRDGFPGLRVPLPIDAHQYAMELQRNPATTLIEFSLRPVCATREGARVAADRLRDRCQHKADALLLIDNWDAIPTPLLQQVLEKLVLEEQHVGSVITARHVPPELLHSSSHHLISLFEMTSCIASKHSSGSPYWSQLISYSQSDPSARSVEGQTAACEQAVVWDRDRMQNTNEEWTFDFSHLQVLAQLAFEAITMHQEDADSPRPGLGRFGLGRHRIEHLAWQNQVDARPLFRSRYFRQLEIASDRYEFADQTIETHLASIYFCESLSKEKQTEFAVRSLNNPMWFEVLKYALRRSEKLCDTLRHEFPTLLGLDDRCHDVLVRLVELAIIANWSLEDLSSPSYELRQRIWFAILKTEQSCRMDKLVRALAKLDCKYLAQRAFNDLDSSHPVVEATNKALAWKPDPSIESDTSTDWISVAEQRRCLRRIAALPPNHPEVCDSLVILARSPTSTGGALLISLAEDESLSDRVRVLALEALSHCGDDALHRSLIEIHRTTTSCSIRHAIGEIASRQTLGLDMPRLESEIFGRRDTESWSVALAACFSSYPIRSKQEQNRIRMIFCTLLTEGLKQPKTDGFEITWREFHRARAKWGHSMSDLVSDDTPLWFDRNLLMKATTVLNEFVQSPQRVGLQRLQNAAMVLRYSVYEDCHLHLVDATNVVIQEAVRQGSVYHEEPFRSVMKSLIETIANIQPAFLIEMEIACSLIGAEMVRRRWLLYHDRIVDHRMQTIALRRSGPMEKYRVSTPEVVQQIVEDLPPRQRNDFLSYWHTISEGGQDYAATDRETVHQAICTVMESDTNTLLSERLHACYCDGGPPSFGSWKKNLARVVHRCDKHPEWIAHLERMGLTSHRRRPR